MSVTFSDKPIYCKICKMKHKPIPLIVYQIEMARQALQNNEKQTRRDNN